jgi:citrate synthase
MEEVIATRQVEVKEFNKEHGKTVIGEVTVGAVIGGMRGLPGMLYETSKLHHIDGIEYRGYDLNKVKELSPKTVPGGQPIPEATLWLLLTGSFPNEKEIGDFKEEMFKRGQLTADEEKMIKSFPKNMHPMTQFSAGVLACQPRSKFVEAYQNGIHKSKYWEPTLEDALDLCAKVSRIAALVFHNCYGTGAIPDMDPKLDYGANYANMLGISNPDFHELMRLYIVIHA